MSEIDLFKGGSALWIKWLAEHSGVLAYCIDSPEDKSKDSKFPSKLFWRHWPGTSEICEGMKFAMTMKAKE